MGHIRTPKFELQFKDTEGRHLITGVDSFREALKKIELHFSDDPKNLTGDVYLWGNSAAGRRIIEDKGVIIYILTLGRARENLDQ